MKLNKSFEQAVYVLTMLALQENHTPVKSRVLSDILEVSDSYLKKILVKLTRAGLIQSNASKVGGYQLAQSVTTITLKDVFFALDLQANVIEFKHMAHHIYDDTSHVKQVENKVQQTMEKGIFAFYHELDTLTIADLLQEEAYENGAINWSNKVKNHLNK